MFDLFKKTDRNIYSPVKGEMIPLEQVPDKVFAQKLLGDGVAFLPQEDMFYAPCNGKVTMVADTKHAVGIQADNGAELLIHIGLETVSLGGEGFTVYVSAGDKVKTGTPLIKADRALLRERNINTVTSMVVTNEKEMQKEKPCIVEQGSVVFSV